MKALDALNQKEEELMDIVKHQEGLSMEERYIKLESLSVFKQYNHIHNEYSSLLYDKLAGLEALKRAIFIQWYSVSEPACYSGISELDKNNEKKVLNRIEEMVIKNELDGELQWMLSYYYSISDWYFDNFERSNTISNFMGENKNKTPVFRREAMNERGQMGFYWSNLN